MHLLLADDHAIFREGLKTFLERQGFDVSAEASDGREAVCLAQRVHPDVAVLDLAMPVLNGIDAAREINACAPRTKTVLLTMHDEESFVLEALGAGIRGYVLKAQAAHDLVSCLKDTARGLIYLSPGLPRGVIESCLRRGERPVDALTSRERQVIGWVAQGRTSRDMARILGISPKTVEADRSRIMRKLNIRDTAGLVRFAVRHRLIEP